MPAVHPCWRKDIKDLSFSLCGSRLNPETGAPLPNTAVLEFRQVPPDITTLLELREFDLDIEQTFLSIISPSGIVTESRSFDGKRYSPINPPYKQNCTQNTYKNQA